MLHEYEQLRENLQLPEMKTTGIRVEETGFSEPEMLLSAMQAWKEMHGWVCFQSGMQILPDAELRRDLGFPVSAEIAGDGWGARLLPDGRGGWRLTTIREDADADRQVLFDELRQEGNAHAPGALCYRRYWERQEDMGYVPVAARLTGFGGVKA